MQVATADQADFDRELERVRLRVLRFVADTAARADLVGPLDDKLAKLDGRNVLHGARAAILARQLRLDADLVQLLWSVVAATLDPHVALQLAEPGPRVGRVGISLAQHAAIFGLDPHRARALASALDGSGLLEHELIEPVDDQPWTAMTAFVAPPRVVSYLRGQDAIDRTLAAAGGLIGLPATLVEDPDQVRARGRIVELLGSDLPPVIVLQGKRGVGRRTTAAAAARAPVIALDMERVPHGLAAWSRALTALRREMLLGHAIPLIANVDQIGNGDSEASGRRRELARFVDRCETPVFLTCARAIPHLEVSRSVVRFELAVPGPRTRAALWRASIAGKASVDDDTISRAALRFQLGAGGIRAAAAGAAASANTRGGAVGPEDVAEGVRATVEERLQGLAHRHRSSLTWDDVVLPSDTREQVDLLLARVRHAYQVIEDWGFARHLPGTGVAALFSGAPGTGKTMLASVIARTLGLELYRVDLAQVTSKWIGETEKHLDEIFSAAETGHAVLLFDEADALFAKRTEVRGATERYANLEVNFLLQRIESFGGVAILTTNMDGSLDPAFRRRLAAHIHFPHPDEDERLELWRRLMPSAAPRAADLRLEDLAARFPDFAGAHIRNALTTAAFLAAARQGSIDHATLLQAASEEARAMGRIVKTGSLA